MTAKELKEQIENADDNAEVQIVTDELEKVAEIDRVEIEQVALSHTVYIIAYPAEG